jgi:putative transposase
LNRSSYYYQGKPEFNDADLFYMGEIDRIFTQNPCYGEPRITAALRREGHSINHKRVERLMGVMGIEAIYPKPKLSLNREPHPIYPYLLKGLKIIRPNQVWGVDITYVRLEAGFLYLVAILDWFSRYVLAYALSDTLASDFCTNASKQALNVALPDIHNSDQGVQFTSEDYLNLLTQYPQIQISMDHRGRCFDNIFTERLWRTVKYEEVYVKSYTSPKEAAANLARYFSYYNGERLHSSLNYRTPAEVYFNN